MPTATKAANSHAAVVTGWTNATNAFATVGDNIYATAAPGKNATVSGDFGFPTFPELQAGYTINSVTARVEWKLSNTTAATLGIQIYDNGVASGTETTYSSTTEAQSTTTGAAGITAQELIDGQIKARVRDTRGNTNTAHTGSVDFVSLTVDYTAATTYNDSPSGTLALSGSRTESATRSTTPTGTIALTGSIVESWAGVYSDAPTGTLAITGSLARSTSFNESPQGTLAITGLLAEQYESGAVEHPCRFIGDFNCHPVRRLGV